MPEELIIKNVEIIDASGKKVQPKLMSIYVADGIIESLSPGPVVNDALVLDGQGALLLPGLKDHHIHFLALAASRRSVSCGPPDVNSPAELRQRLYSHEGTGWLRGFGYHESIGVDIDRKWLDSNGPDRPIRVQHRTGRQWILNSNAIAMLIATTSDPSTIAKLDTEDGKLFDQDALVRRLLPPDLSTVRSTSQFMASYGITAFNDMTATNSAETFLLFEQLQQSGDLCQRVRLSGDASLSSVSARSSQRLQVGETKVHLHEGDLPDFSVFVETICASHAAGRGVAVHCVTETELVFTLAAMREAGETSGVDRIEHASIAPAAVLEQIRALGVSVVTQPAFVAERGDTYIRELPGEQENLYRVKSFLAGEVPVAFSSDAPFTGVNPWAGMQAACDRRTPAGATLGIAECVSPQTALLGYLGDLESPSVPVELGPGSVADLCLLDRDYQSTLENLLEVQVDATFIDGVRVY